MKYVVRVVPIARLEMEPYDLGPYRWQWVARWRLRTILADAFLRSAATFSVQQLEKSPEAEQPR